MKKIFKALSSLAVAVLLVSACNVEHHMPTYSPVYENEASFLQTVYNNKEIQGTAATEEITITRNSCNNDLTVPILSWKEEENKKIAAENIKLKAEGKDTIPLYEILVNYPESATFAAGEYSTSFIIDVSILPVGKVFTDELMIVDTTVTNVNVSNTRSKITLQKVYTWVSLGKGEWFDNLLLYSGASLGIQEVEVLKAEGFDRYRIMAPYANTDQLAAGISAHFGTSATLAGPSNNKDNYIEFWVLENGENVAWDGWWYPGVLYQGIDMKGYYPSYLTGSTAEDALSGFYDELVVGFYPYWYMDDLGGFGAKYPCFLSLPGGPALESWL